MRVFDYGELPVSCRKCDECIKARKRHWIGRINAEAETTEHIHFVTFTYAGGYENKDAYSLNYKHVQDMFKRMRRKGMRFSYVCVGEYGGKRDRAHFHALMFWKTPPPDVPLDRRIDWDEWPHGYSQFELPRSKQACASYIMDYLDKTNLLENELKYSKRPALGTDYLLQYAREHAKAGIGLFAQSDRFTIPGNVSAKTGKQFYYPVGRKTAIYQKMLDEYTYAWAAARPKQRMPMNDDLKEHLETICQDPHNQQPAVTDWLAEVYGYDDFDDNDRPTRRETYHTFADGWQIKVTAAMSTAVLVDPLSGESLWLVPVDLGNLQGDLTETAIANLNKLRQSQSQVAQRAQRAVNWSQQLALERDLERKSRSRLTAVGQSP